MRNAGKLFLSVMVVFALLISILPTTVYANSAEPPSIVILVNNPPEDLSIILISDKNQTEATVRRVAWEGYYVFYSRDMEVNGEYTFKITTKGENFKCTIGRPLQHYNNVFTLNLSKQVLTPGKYPYRAALLISIRLLLTLFIEGIIYWLFGFRQKSSWLIFLTINIVTQGALNIWLNSEASQMPNYLILSLLLCEFYVFVVEMIAFPILVKEHSKKRSFFYAFIANLVSLIIGGYFISLLPV